METLIREEYDSHSGITYEFYYIENPGETPKLTIRATQNVEDIIDTNVAQFNENTKKFNNAVMYHAARIPFIELERWKRDFGFDWFNSTDDERRKWLEKSELRKWKVNSAKLHIPH